MLKVKSYNSKGEELKPVTLPKDVFGLKINLDLLHQAVSVQLANRRRAIAHTKTRGEVAGSTRKPWRQKGTGRARAGSIRSPLWIGGGVVFGPRNIRNFAQKLPKKMKRLAILQALSSKAQDKKLIILDKLTFPKIKTKVALQVLESLPVAEGTFLIVLEKPDPVVELSFRNLPYCKTILANNLNIYDILKYQWLILTAGTLAIIEKTFIRKKDKEKKVKSPEIKKKEIKTKKTL